MVNERMLREKIGALETQNMRLVQKLKELLSAKGDIRMAINLINDHCKQNDCSVVINNKNKLIKEIKYNKAIEFPDYMKVKQKNMKNLDIRINMKIPEDISLDDTYDLVKQTTRNVSPEANVSWELEKEKLSPKKLLRLSAQGKLSNMEGSPFEDVFNGFFGNDLKKRVIFQTKIRMRELEKEIKRLKNAKTNKKRKRRSKKTKQTKKTNKR